MRVVQLRMQPNLALYEFHLCLGRHIAEVDLPKQLDTTFKAYMRQVVRWRARRTVPNDPHPTFLSWMIWNSLMVLNLRFEGTLSILFLNTQESTCQMEGD